MEHVRLSVLLVGIYKPNTIVDSPWWCPRPSSFRNLTLSPGFSFERVNTVAVACCRAHDD